MSFEPRVRLLAFQNLHIIGRPSRYCISNLSTQNYNNVYIEALHPYTGYVADSESFGGVPAGSIVCRDTGLDGFASFQFHVLDS